SIRNNRTNRRRERYRRRHRFVFSAEARRSEFQGALPVSSGENTVVYGESESADVSLFWLQRWRQRFPVRNGIRARRFSSSRAQARGARRDHHSRKTWRGRRRSTLRDAPQITKVTCRSCGMVPRKSDQEGNRRTRAKIFNATRNHERNREALAAWLRAG